MALLSNFNQISTSSGTPINMIQGSDSPIGWTGTNAVVATETSPALIPYHPLKTTAIRINSTSGNGYGSTTFTVPAGVPATLMGISFGFESNDTSTWLVQLWQGATQQTLSVGFINGTTTPVTFNTTAVLTGGLTYELRIISVLNNKTCYINNVTASLNLAAPANVVGAAISEWQTYTPTIGGTSSNGTVTYTVQNGRWRRVGSAIQVQARITLNTVSASPTGYYTISLPSGLTLNNSTTSVLGGATIQQTGYTRTDLIVTSNASATVVFIAANDLGVGPASLVAASSISAEFEVEIAEWAGSGTVNLGPGAQIEYLSHDGTSASTTWALVPNIAGASSHTTYTLTPQYPCQSDDVLEVEMRAPTNDVLSNGSYPWIQGTSNFMFGMQVRKRTNGQVEVFFGNGGFSPTSGLGAAATGNTWADFRATGWTWRVRKAKASSPVGFGLAGTDGSSGLYQAGRAPGIITGATIPVGMIGESYETNSTTLFTTTAANIDTRTLAPGKWKITVTTTAFSTAGTTLISVSISTSSAVEDGTYVARGAVAASSWGTACVTRIVNISSNTQYWVTGSSAGANVNQQQRTTVYWERIA